MCSRQKSSCLFYKRRNKESPAIERSSWPELQEEKQESPAIERSSWPELREEKPAGFLCSGQKYSCLYYKTGR
ncbi:hypothetical protein ACOMHN_060953 [Nucella lapillus]